VGVRLISIIVLAAGEASRFGSPKQLAMINERSLLELAFEKCVKLKAQCSETGLATESILALGAHFDSVQEFIASQPKLQWDSIQHVSNWQQGMGRSIAEVFRNQLDGYSAESHIDVGRQLHGALVILVDQPMVCTQELFHMLDRGVRENCVFCSSYPKTIGPPAYFPRHEMQAYIERFESSERWQGGAKMFIQERTHTCLDMRGVLYDIDTPVDLTRVSKL